MDENNIVKKKDSDDSLRKVKKMNMCVWVFHENGFGSIWEHKTCKRQSVYVAFHRKEKKCKWLTVNSNPECELPLQ